jgi:hypothetical protein
MSPRFSSASSWVRTAGASVAAGGRRYAKALRAHRVGVPRSHAPPFRTASTRAVAPSVPQLHEVRCGHHPTTIPAHHALSISRELRHLFQRLPVLNLPSSMLFYLLLPILKRLVPQVGQTPLVAGRPFFIVISAASFISRLLLHFTQ